jgi:hypothetical protein
VAWQWVQKAFMDKRIPRFGVTRTLLDCTDGPDVNRRTIVDSWNGFADVCVFNQWMDPWTAQDEHRLNIVLKALNQMSEQEEGGADGDQSGCDAG